ncbi:uncharacterized protein C20orf85 homolog [Hydractinia symbiolongicarpus]|uniref:uncharacterized protein C20orf85 homolog n=1 Tax=Hydractinia symbiolongicarpus TaxID=13093 RepID=UPI00254FFA34|nr:uncharacterized protein C20orf85 homolog [Hydractinia symbiolongicarpus]
MVKPGKIGNVVAEDLIWKDHVLKEHTAVKQWSKNWSFLANLSIEERQQRKKQRSNYLSKNEENELKLPLLVAVNTQSKQDTSFPKTSTGLIGWKSSNPKMNLERYGNYAKPVRTFLCQMNWPAEGMM